jgi:hypothetical protein
MPANIFIPIGLVIVIALFALLIYWVLHPSTKNKQPIILDSMPQRKNLPWYTSVLWIIILVPFLYVKYLVGISSQAPFIGAVFGVAIFIFMCLANWYPPLRRKVNYWLTLQDDEALAYAWAEPVLYGLNGLVILIALVLVVF